MESFSGAGQETRGVTLMTFQRSYGRYNAKELMADNLLISIRPRRMTFPLPLFLKITVV